MSQLIVNHHELRRVGIELLGQLKIKFQPSKVHLQGFYFPIHHGWLVAMLVCVLGTLFNLANIMVLTHRDMRNPVNMILTGIAVADFLNNLEYIPFTVHMNIYDIEGRHPEEKVKQRSYLHSRIRAFLFLHLLCS